MGTKQVLIFDTRRLDVNERCKFLRPQRRQNGLQPFDSLGMSLGRQMPETGRMGKQTCSHVRCSGI